MFFFFTFGGTNFNKADPRYQGHVFYCPHCHNNSVLVVKVREFFTFCFVPVIPTHWGMELQCSICRWSQSTNESMVDGMIKQQAQVNSGYQAREAMSYPSDIQRPAMTVGK